MIIASVAGKENPIGCLRLRGGEGGRGRLREGLARELQPSGITVNCIAPAITETELMEEMSESYIAEKKRLIPIETSAGWRKSRT